MYLKILGWINADFHEVKRRILGCQPLHVIGEVFVEVRRGESCRIMMLKKKGVAAPVEKSAMTALDTTANKVFN